MTHSLWLLSVAIFIGCFLGVVIYNAIKHHKVVKAAKEDRLHKLEMLKAARQMIQGASLSTLFQIHKDLGKNGLCSNPCLCPDKYGVFRTSDIATMDESEVFLGNIYGLWTFSLPYWESCKDEDAKEKVTNQYYQLLLRGIELEHQKYER